MTADRDRPSEARYVFRVTFGLAPSVAGVTVEPNTFSTTVYRHADPPGEAGWLFFRDHLWRGEVGDESHLRALTEVALGVPVRSVQFQELQTDAAYLEALRATVADNLAAFNADTVDEALTKYLGSSIRVRPDED